MDPNKQKEQFSNAFVHAAAAVAGFATSKQDVDDDSIDWTLSQTGGNGTVRSPKLDLQLKCTESGEELEGTHLHFPLKVKNYNDLRPENVQVPRILVVVLVPEDLANWLRLTEEALLLRSCAYWVSLRGQPPTANEHTVTVQLPRVQRFDAEGVSEIMSRVAQGQLP